MVFNWSSGRALRKGLLSCFFALSIAAVAQDNEFKPVPILTGSTAYFTRVNAGQYSDVPSVSPLLLVPVGDKPGLAGKLAAQFVGAC